MHVYHVHQRGSLTRERTDRFRRHGGLLACMSAVALLAALPASGQTFSYTEDFNSVANGTTPPGWVVNTSGNNPIPLAGANPRVLSADPLGWATPVDYSVPWSGGSRFTLLHPAWVPGQVAAGAAFTGTGASFGGTYPLHLQTDALKAEFDLVYRTGDTTTVAHGCTFVIQPVADVQHVRTVGRAYGRMGFDMNGFAIEFDSYNNTGFGGSGRGDPSANHIGVDLYRLWDIANANDMGDGIAGNNIAGGITVPSLKTSVDLGITDLPAFNAVGDNNQPMHVTVFYNDPSHGGLGTVQVYVKVDPTTGSMAYAETENNGLGRLVVQACVGSFPTQNAVFGFTASCSGSHNISQVDNVHVETNAVAGGSACPVTYPDLTAVYLEGVPVFDPGVAVNLDATPLQTTTAGLSSPGWEVTSYWSLIADTWPGFAGQMDIFKGAMSFQAAKGWRHSHAMGEPDINYWVVGGDVDGNIGDNRLVPGIPAAGMQWFGILAKGYIYFPQAGDFSLCVNSDDAFELMIGGQIVSNNPANVNAGVPTTGLNGGSSINLHVAQAGVYPIQLIYLQRNGNGYVEFYRRTDTPMMPYLLVGTNSAGLPDQPVIYGLRNEASAPDTSATYPQIGEPSLVNLSPTQAINGTPDGPADFKVKFVKGPMTYVYAPANPAPNIYYYSGNTDLFDVAALRWMDVLDGMPGAPTTTPVINFTSLNDNDSHLLGGAYFATGLEPTPGSFGMRADGFVTFATPGVYYLSMTANDTGFLRIGDQTICKVWDYNSYDWPNMFRLNVTQAGTYPIRFEAFGGFSAGGNNFELLEYNENGMVAVNGPGSHIAIHEAAKTAGGAPLVFPWRPNGLVLPGDRKVANNGDADPASLGWFAKMARSSAWWPAYASHATALIENNTYYKYDGTVNPAGGGPTNEAEATDTPTVIDYADPTQGHSGRFSVDNPLTNFGAAYVTPGSGGYALSATGYIEFPAAGDYALDLHVANGGQLWVGGLVMTWKQYLGASATGDNDIQHAIIHVDEPGIYDIRADFNFWQLATQSPSTFEIFQILPNGSYVLVNDPASTVKVYRELRAGVTPASTMYHNPTQVPASAKAGSGGGQSGMRLQIVNCRNGVTNRIAAGSANEGNWYGGTGVDGGWGADEMVSLPQAHRLLASVLDGVPSLDQFGVLVSDAIRPRVAYFPRASASQAIAPWDWAWPAGTQANWMAARVSGYLDVKKGGHLFFFYCSDGVSFTLGGQNWRTGGYITGPDWGSFCYMYIPEDGLYPFTLEYNQFDGNEFLSLMEYKKLGVNSRDLANYEVVNDPGSATKAYATLCGVPFADMDDDRDVDQDDFGLFQACHTGPTAPTGGLQGRCACLDRTAPANGTVDSADLEQFMYCFTGPAVLWTPTTNCP